MFPFMEKAYIFTKVFELITQKKNAKMRAKYFIWGNEKPLREKCIKRFFELLSYQIGKTHEWYFICKKKKKINITKSIYLNVFHIIRYLNVKIHRKHHIWENKRKFT